MGGISRMMGPLAIFLGTTASLLAASLLAAPPRAQSPRSQPGGAGSPAGEQRPAISTPAPAEAPTTSPEGGEPATRVAHETIRLRGRVVFAADALARRFGIKTVPETRRQLLVLETAAGQLIPLVDDIRGRSFRTDQRLRDRDTELLVRRYRGSPLVQVIRIFQFEGGEKQEIDYWCEICAIAMFELKACDCCQGDIELRRRKVSAAE